MTEEQAIQKLLVLVGEDPSLSEGDTPYDLAETILRAVTQEVTSGDWYDVSSPITDISTAPKYLIEYIITKAAYYYVMGYTGENTFTQELLAQLQQLEQRAKQYSMQQQMGFSDFDTLLTQVRIQLLNEAGWWFNTIEDTDGTLKTSVPTTLPQIVEEYVKAKAKRIYTAYQTGQMDLLVNSTPEEQELYNQMRIEHNRNLLKSKSLTTLKNEITRELLMFGWDFNTIEDTYINIKTAGYTLLFVKALTPNKQVFLDSDGLVKDNETRTETDDDTILKVLIDVSYDNLPPLFKSYVDLKARRLFKHYDDPSGGFDKPSVDEQTLFMHLKTLHKRDIDTANMLYDDYTQYNYRGW